ncbi:RT_RNaseH_2 domain-containing protein [Trichonephila inaurata madagascariensis]|uniref:RT_RNaseH_2 domain-containing protein n=1 Tax=Trichonephila inaurata madagascariensis TaxID=2747483 RepID=A0A8X6Y5A5_9ARAC|nr:RT_RNaseH_2 domain-containing protein [Trichonephila inaurata madagascariensis]
MGGSHTNKEHYCKNYLRSFDENFISNRVPKDNMNRPEYQFYYTIVSSLSRCAGREKELPTSGARSVEEYLKQLQKKLQDEHEIASENSAKNQERTTLHYNLRSREKSFSVGDEILILMPSYMHKLLNIWIGPAKEVKLTRPHSCLVQMEDGSTRELYVNKIRPYISRVDHVGIIFDQDSDFGELHYVPTDKATPPNIDIKLNQILDVLNSQQKYQLRKLLQYEDIFRNRPGKAKVKGQSVKVTADSSPRILQPYRVPIALQKEVER